MWRLKVPDSVIEAVLKGLCENCQKTKGYLEEDRCPECTVDRLLPTLITKDEKKEEKK